MTPRSTTPSTTFSFESFDSSDTPLDWQLLAITVKASIIDPVKSLILQSSSNEVAAVNQELHVTFQTPKTLKPSDQIHLSIPKWDATADSP